VDFTEKYGRILHILKRPVQKSVIMVLVYFWDPLYNCFTFKDMDLVPTIEEYYVLTVFL
jgi:hypothetical protein